MADTLTYTETLTSTRTLALFAGLTLLFGALCLWRASTASLDALALASGVIAAIFLFYVFNFRVLKIQLTSQVLRLTFGIFTWSEPLANLSAPRLDEIPPFLRYGGAGIHFLFVNGRYRVSFNFLEYPRVVVVLRQPKGAVRDISFSTRQPDQILQFLQACL